MKNNKIIVILGVHRSGTSLLTRSLRCFNFNYGEKLHPSGTDNPKGFFEDVDIIELNEKILAEINFSWDSPQLLDDAKLEIIRKKFSTKAKKLILEKINKGITCFKDPRITKLIDFWVEIFESLKQDQARRNNACLRFFIGAQGSDASWQFYSTGFRRPNNRARRTAVDNADKWFSLKKTFWKTSCFFVRGQCSECTVSARKQEFVSGQICTKADTGHRGPCGVLKGSPPTPPGSRKPSN